MLGELANHLWQSTLYLLAAALVAHALRSNHAAVRYWVWLTASVKFLVPLALLVSLGHHMRWASATAQQVVAQPAISFATQASQPFTAVSPRLSPAQYGHHWGLLTIVGIWAAGCIAIVWMRLAGWRRIRAALRASTIAPIPAAIEVRFAPGLLEPGVVGLLHPVLLLPRDITERLFASELQGVLSHELCHARRRDNLTAAIHMVVEAAFWFHPLVWWIGAHLIEERERACDEEVLRQGNKPGDYAQTLLKVCRSYLESPLSCASGVTGWDLKRRIEVILAGAAAREVSLRQKLAIAFAAIAVLAIPLALGISTPAGRQAESRLQGLKFRTAAITSCAAFRKPNVEDSRPGVFHSECTTAERLIEQAYGLFANGQWNLGSSLVVSGGPDWIKSELFEVEAIAPGERNRSTMNGPMLQALLESRFHLRVRRETNSVPVYTLTVAAVGPKLRPFAGTCRPRDFDKPPSDTDCATARTNQRGFDLKAASMEDFCAGFSVFLNRQIVNGTGLRGRFDFTVALPPQDRALLHRPRSLPAVSNPFTGSTPPIPFESAQAAMQGLGLHLAPGEARGDLLVVDHIEQPSAN